MNTLLFIAAAVLVVLGIVQILHGAVLWGILLVVLGCLVGPGGYSLTRRA